MPAGTLTGEHSPILTCEQGRTDAGHWADYINVGFEHGSFNPAGLDDYLHGMVDAGPTRSGHRTPAVIVEAPVGGISREMVRFNAWQFQQILARGVHGIILCQATVPGAVQAFVEGCRYAVNRTGVGKGLDVGYRGIGSERSAAHVWGVDADTYIAKADPWPLTPDGELLLGVKIESKAAVPHVEEILAVPGIMFAEVGPGDLGLTLGYRKLPDPWPPEMVEIEQRVAEACRASAWLRSVEWSRQALREGLRPFGRDRDASNTLQRRRLPSVHRQRRAGRHPRRDRPRRPVLHRHQRGVGQARPRPYAPPDAAWSRTLQERNTSMNRSIAKCSSNRRSISAILPVSYTCSLVLS